MSPHAAPPPPAAAHQAGRPAGEAERAAVLEAVRPGVERTLGKRVRFAVDRLQLEGRWAFLTARLEDARGSRFSYEGTPRAEDARHGLVSDRYAALLSHSAAGWSVVAEAIGPTDVAWEGWAAEYAAPAGLFAR